MSALNISLLYTKSAHKKCAFLHQIGLIHQMWTILINSWQKSKPCLRKQTNYRYMQSSAILLIKSKKTAFPVLKTHKFPNWGKNFYSNDRILKQKQYVDVWSRLKAPILQVTHSGPTYGSYNNHTKHVIFWMVMIVQIWPKKNCNNGKFLIGYYSYPLKTAKMDLMEWKEKAMPAIIYFN